LPAICRRLLDGKAITVAQTPVVVVGTRYQPLKLFQCIYRVRDTTLGVIRLRIA
jgi:hypothetical protein